MLISWDRGLSLSTKPLCLNELTNLFFESDMLGSQPVDTPMDLVVRFDRNLGDALEDSSRYRRVIGKLIHFTVTRPYIIFVVGVLSWYMQTSHQLHWDVACRVL